jgi:hypothetical protein
MSWQHATFAIYRAIIIFDGVDEHFNKVVKKRLVNVTHKHMKG